MYCETHSKTLLHILAPDGGVTVCGRAPMGARYVELPEGALPVCKVCQEQRGKVARRTRKPDWSPLVRPYKPQRFAQSGTKKHTEPLPGQLELFDEGEVLAD
jgi:hypothetical protein